ncbi:DinB family protein [Bradyrhizobium sp. 2TAF24]|uniref:DinB family protein n=1 Tax=Bradyrhizobium sp. 2TAF24 TaxID=3233011 RepID=UPI003F8E6D62
MDPLIEHYRAMARNNAWSNARLSRTCSRLSDHEFARERTNFFPSLQLTLNHILLVDRFYLTGLAGSVASVVIFADKIPFPTMQVLTPAQRELDLRLIAFCDGLAATSLDQTVLLDRGPAGLHRETVATVLPHLFLHQIHHRGQATAMLAGTAERAPQLDEFFLLGDRAARAQDPDDMR